MAGNPSARIDNFVAVPEEEMKLLTQRTGMPISQQNGQRKYGPPRDYDGPEPLKGSEVFIGKLPRDLFEPDIVRVCETVGRIYEIRMMMDFSGTNRGYCFVKFFTPEEANRAVTELNNYEIKKGRTIGVLISVDNCRLFMGGIPRNKTEAEIFEEVSNVTDGVRRVICYPSAEDKTKNRGFAFVEYESHRDAAMARRKLLPKRIPMWGEFLQVDWAEPLPDVNPSIMEKVTKLYVRNLSLATTEEELVKRFNECSENGVERVKKIKDFAFVHFATREQADKARNTLDRTEIDGCLIDIEWAKPPEDTYKAKKALSRQPRPNYQRVPGDPAGFPRGLFSGYQGMATGHTRYSNMQPTIEGVPLGPSYEQQIEALEAAFARQTFFAPRVMKPRENNRGRAAAGVQNFHLSEAVIQQQRRVYQYPDSPSNGYGPDQYIHSGYYPYPVFAQELHQQYSQEISHNY